MTEIDNNSNDKGFIFFGRDVSKIPCFRNSLLYGISGGLCCGLGRFMFTSQPLKSVHFAVYSFSLITMGYWMQCRYTFSKTKHEILKMQELLEQAALLEGSEDERLLDDKLGANAVDV